MHTNTPLTADTSAYTADTTLLTADATQIGVADVVRPSPVAVPLPGRFMWASWLTKLAPLLKSDKKRRKKKILEEPVVEELSARPRVDFTPEPVLPRAVDFSSIRIPQAPDLHDEDAEIAELVELLTVVDAFDAINERRVR